MTFSAYMTCGSLVLLIMVVIIAHDDGSISDLPRLIDVSDPKVVFSVFTLLLIVVFGWPLVLFALLVFFVEEDDQ